MALDFAVLGSTGAPEKSVALSPKTHGIMIDYAHKLNLNHMLQFIDYYQDVEVFPENLHVLIEQAQKLVSLELPSDLTKFMSDLLALASYAEAKKTSLHALAD